MLITPFSNDTSAIVAIAFKELYPDTSYHAQLVPELEDDSGEKVYGLTLFPDDNSEPIICISGKAPIEAEAELFAHELAHIVAGIDAKHGPTWESAFEAIFQKYNEIIETIETEE